MTLVESHSSFVREVSILTMLRKSILHKTKLLINCRYASQSMLQSTVDEKSGNALLLYRPALIIVHFSRWQTEFYLFFVFTGIATVVMNKPPVNSLNYEFLDEIKTQLNQLQNDKVRGMILTSVRTVSNTLCSLVYFKRLFTLWHKKV